MSSDTWTYIGLALFFLWIWNEGRLRRKRGEESRDEWLERMAIGNLRKWSHEKYKENQRENW